MKRLMRATEGRCVSAGGKAINSRRLYVVEVTSAVAALISQGKLVGNGMVIPDQANDEDFQKYWDDCEGNETLAIDSYISSFDDEDEPKQAAAVVPKVTAQTKPLPVKGQVK